MEFRYLSRLMNGFQEAKLLQVLRQRQKEAEAKRGENKGKKSGEQTKRQKTRVGGEGVGEESPRDFFGNICLWLFQIKELILDWGVNKEVP